MVSVDEPLMTLRQPLRTQHVGRRGRGGEAAASPPVPRTGSVRLDGSECFAAGNLPKRFMGSFLGAKNLLLEPQAKIAGSFQCSGNGGRDRD
jgi:hypothetical protein